MRTRRQVLGTVAAMTALAGCSGGGVEGNSGPGLFAPAFDSQTIPNRYTCTGGNISPEIEFSNVSRETEAFALIMDDPDAPGSEPFVHWLIWNVSPNLATLPEGIPKQPRVDLSTVEGRKTDPGFPETPSGRVFQGTNSTGEIGYSGPCPPPEDPPHTYELTAYALRSTIDVPPGARRPTLESAIRDEQIGTTTLTGMFER